jgi:2-methylcitrate synthase
MSDDIKKGLLGIVVDETEVSKVMPEINSLTYRGYAAQDLCEYCRFEEVAYLILNKDLPNTIQLRQFEKEEKNNRELTKNLYEIIKHMPKKSHPMDVAKILKRGITTLLILLIKEYLNLLHSFFLIL